MIRAKNAVAIAVLVVVAATAWIPHVGGQGPTFVDSLLALMAFSLELSGGGSMGFVFLILSVSRLSWLDSVLMADAALLLVAIVRRERPDPAKLLRTLAATTLAALGAHAAFQITDIPELQVPFDYVVASGMCFVGMNIFDWKREVLWSYPYYLVAAAVGALFPIPAVLPVLLLITWRSYRIYERRLERQYQELKRTSELHIRTMETLARAVGVRDRPLSGQSRRVQVYTEAMARELNLPEEQREALRVASLLYDIGELAVPEHILSKSGKLTPEEFDKVRIHPEVGAKILERVNFPYPVIPIVMAHHERWNGSGYPKGLIADEIPLGARILAVADTVDALASQRYHRPPVALDEAVAQVVANSGSYFDPFVVELLQKNYRIWERDVAEDAQADFTVSILSAQREAQVLFDLTAKLGISLDLDETFRALQNALGQLMVFDSIVIWIEREGFLTVEQALGSHLSAWSPLKIPVGKGLSGQVAEGAPNAMIGDAALDLRPSGMSATMHPFRYALSAPLASGEVKGAVTLYGSSERPFTPEHARILTQVAPKLAAAIANGLKFRQAQNRAGADSLTGLPNTAALADRMSKLDSPCAIVVCDLDGFKKVNDQYGHLTGNRVLQAVAEGFRASCRDQDFVARMGGDEFVLLLSGVSPEGSAVRLGQFSDMIRSVGTRITGSDALGASFGTSFYPTDGKAPDELLAKADKRMYQQKGDSSPKKFAARVLPHNA
jgi:diguanylate cyclase (GGDEF)-like protein/putative nucleotidyltransferase with HDIG domain